MISINVSSYSHRLGQVLFDSTVDYFQDQVMSVVEPLQITSNPTHVKDMYEVLHYPPCRVGIGWLVSFARCGD